MKPWEEYQQQSQDGPWAEYQQQPTQAPTPKPKRDAIETALRYGAVAGRGAATGLTGIPAIAAQAGEDIAAIPRALVRQAMGINIPTFKPLEMWQKGLDVLYGGIQPETTGERLTQDVTTAMGGGALFPGAAVPTGISSALSGLGAGTAREMGAGPVGQFAAGMAAPLGPYAALKTAQLAGVPIKTGSRIVDAVLLPGGEKRAAGRVLGKIAAEGKQAKTVKQALTNAQKIDDVVAALDQALPGETAAQAVTKTGNAPFVALGRIVEQEMPSEAVRTTAAQEAARRAAIQAVTPDEQAAIAARSAATAPLYEQASQATIPVVGKLREVFSRMPRTVINQAQKMARTEGRPFVMIEGENPAVSGETMHYIKRALSDIVSAKQQPGITADYQRSVTGLLDDFLKVYGGTGGVEAAANPLYGEARRKFAELSVPINQSRVLQTMQAELAKPGGGERVGPFLNVLGKGESALLKRATGFPRYETGQLGKVLSPEQLKTVQSVSGQLERDIAEQELAKAGTSKMLSVLRENERPENIMGGVLERNITITNNILRILEGKGGKAVDAEIARLMQPANKQELIGVLLKAKPNTKAMMVREFAKRGIKLPASTVGTLLTIKQED